MRAERGVPRELYAKKLFRFDGLTADEIARYVKSGSELARRIRASRSPDGPPQADAQPATAHADLGLDWVALEERHGFNVGDAVDVHGARSLAHLAG